jgi:hypothetical protein
MAVLGSQTEPHAGFDIIWSSEKVLAEKITEIGLRTGAATFGGFSEPFQRFGGFTLLLQNSGEFKLRIRATPFPFDAIPFDGLVESLLTPLPSKYMSAIRQAACGALLVDALRYHTIAAAKS